jgi:hypothetical protein
VSPLPQSTHKLSRGLSRRKTLQLHHTLQHCKEYSCLNLNYAAPVPPIAVPPAASCTVHALHHTPCHPTGAALHAPAAQQPAVQHHSNSSSRAHPVSASRCPLQGTLLVMQPRPVLMPRLCAACTPCYSKAAPTTVEIVLPTSKTALHCTHAHFQW